MKNKIIILFSFGIGGCFQYLQAQNQPIFTLCYDEEYIEKISVVSDLEPSTLTILDKLKFKNKQYYNQHHEYINDLGYATHDLYYLSNENMFPEWYSHPSIIRSNETGTKSFFDSTNEYMIDGWTGGIKSRTEHGEYIEDSNTQERYLFQPHSIKANEAYHSWNNWVKCIRPTIHIFQI